MTAGAARVLGVVGVAATLLAQLSPRVAHACGGTFCDGGPTAMNVDQTGENILFVMDGTSVEAHIQIQYDGKNAARFAWILPVQKSLSGAPITIGVGSQLLFANLLAGTVPSYGFMTQSTCQAGQNGASGAAGSASGGFDGAAGSSGGPGPTVTQKGTAGAFEYVVLEGGTAAEVMKWLADNQYQQVPAAEPLLGEYLAKGYQFVAVKLVNGAGVDEIHPLTVKYEGDAPCVPIKLTRIAAAENMGIRTFFLGKGRVVPTNYRHVVLNEARIDWTAFGKNYGNVVNAGMDAPVADGHAFTTEYAGPSSVVPSFGVYQATWNAASFPGLAPEKVVQELTKQGLVSCGGATCTYTHPLVAGLLHEFLPVPDGVMEGAFYSCLACYKADIDTAAWDGAKFGKAMMDRIIAPGKHAADLLKANPYLTRMFTTISPAEMTEDPDFHVRADLPPVSRSHFGARINTCTSLSAMRFSQREVALSASGTWPGWDAEMPWVERVEDIPKDGPVVELVNNTAKIDALIDAWNKSRGWPPPPGTSSTGTGGTTGGMIGGSGNAAGDDGDQGSPPRDEGIGGCSVPGGDRGELVSYGLLALGALALRRARKHR